MTPAQISLLADAHADANGSGVTEGTGNDLMSLASA